ncbi:hydrolase [Rheinheimera sp. SA_1]|jgi:nicotinamidase-related amidase|uniref:hydrolase n=1 Tax=Rheinheimera sp. SA_1 TaxID=1827365 RepID=UPI0007FBEE01|nr:hydrolase [Rheinheimera sp. SA_1]OBP17216.1 hydrolase [Rheinheimera sp. SA_1]
MLVHKDRSVLLVIDLQQKLAPAIHQLAAVMKSACWVLQIANQLRIPVLCTEQYPQGLGPTVPEVATLLAEATVLEKIHFSAWREPAIQHKIQQLKKQQLVLLGTEAHVCVLQTAMDLIEAGFSVFVVEEAVGSRTPANKALALSRLQQAGAQIISQEMLAFEWLEQAATDQFRHISRGWLR